MASIHHQTRHAAIWSALDVFMRQGVQFGVTIVLARLLSPGDFGLLAMLSLFVGLAGIFIDGGLGAALIQRQHSSRTDESSIFFFNLGMGALTALLLCLCAPWIAGFFGQPLLAPLTQALALALFINAGGAIQMTLLQRALDFRAIARIGGVASLLSGLLAIALAMRGYGVWSLAAQAVAASAITVALLWRLHPWRPTRAFSLASLRAYFRFGAYETAANVTDVVSTNLNAILIGKLFSAHDAGLYDRAQRLQQLPANTLTLILNRVAFPAFARRNADKTWLAHGLKRAQQLSMAINLPAMAALIVLAEPLLLTLLGARWVAAAPVVRVLALASVLWPLHVMNLSVLRAQGGADSFFRITMLKKVLTIGLTLAVSPFGALAIAWAQVVTSVFAYFVNTHFSKRLLDYGAAAQLRDLCGLCLATAPMAAAMLAVTAWLDAAPAVTLLLALLAGAVIYWLACRLLCRETLNELLALAGRRARPAQPPMAATGDQA